MTGLTLQDVTKTYTGAARPALDRVSLTVAPGTLTALLGPSGCGKTTAMKLVAGLMQPTSGDILLDGQSVLTVPPERRGAVMVFQNHLLFPQMTLADNIGFGLKMRHLPKAEITARVGHMMARVRLDGLGHRRPSELSGGQQQRAALARALILQPQVLLLDEPLSNLDAHLRDEMRSLIRDLQRETAITTLFVTHDQHEAVVIADRIALLLEGRLAQHGAPATLYARPASAAVARFFGGVNFIAGRVAGGQFHSALGPLRLDHAAPDGPGLLTIRPEALRTGARPDQPNTLTARLTGLVFLGTQTRLLLRVGTQPLEALVTPADAAVLTVGEELALTLPPDALWVMPQD